MIARAGSPSVHAVALAGISVLLLLAAAALPLDAPPLSLLTCPLRSVAGFPCLGCGCTRAFHFAVRGQAPSALASSPLGTLLALAAVVHVAWTALRLAGLPYAPRFDVTRRTRWVAAAALAANWLFVMLRDRP
jgi:hypothetical protein